MPDYTHCYFLLPSHGLDDLPLDYRGTAAENLLDCWTVCWHPAILAATNRVPQMLRGGIDEMQHPHSVVVSPQAALPLLSEGFYESVRRFDTRWIGRESQNLNRGMTGRQQLFQEIIADWHQAECFTLKVSEDIAADFYSLSFCYLQIQLMTRQLRYSSNLDQSKFDQHLMAAALAATESPDAAAMSLQACFDLLLEEKNRYYPVQPKIVDIVLLAKTTLRQSLSDQLQSNHRLTLAASADIFQTLAEVNPSAFERLKSRLEKNECCLIGGLLQELPDPLLSGETTIRQLVAGVAQYQDLFGQRPQTFFRRTSGLHPLLPGALDLLGFPQTLHGLFDSGQVPTASASEIRWEGLDGTSLLAYAGKMLNAADAGDLLNVGTNIGRQIESWHTASLVFAHWPNQACSSFADLLRSQKFGNLLGSVVHLDDFLETAYDPGYSEPLELNDYRWPYLEQATQPTTPQPISRFVCYWHRHYQLLNLSGLITQLAIYRHGFPQKSWTGDLSLLAGRLRELELMLDVTVNPENWAYSAGEAVEGRGVAAVNAPAHTNVTRADPSDSAEYNFESTLKQIKAEIDAAAVQTYQEMLINPQDLIKTGILQTKPTSSIAESPQTGDSLPLSNTSLLTKGIAVHNSMNFRRRMTVLATAPASQFSNGDQGPILFSESQPQSTATLVELPGTGTAIWAIENDSSRPSHSPNRKHIDPPLVDGLKIRNEFFELSIDPQRGSILSLRDYRQRESLVSQQLAARIPAAGSSPGIRSSRYTTMIADSIETITNNRLEGAIRSNGRLLLENEEIAKFVQTVLVKRGRPLAEIEIELTLASVDYRQDRHFYLANRLAWRDETAHSTCNFQECHVAANNEWFFATHFVQIPQSPQPITLLTGGLPYHRRVARRMLDSLLICGGERETRFRIAIGVDIQHPLLAAVSWLTEPIVTNIPHGLARSTIYTGELLHFDRRNILVTSWQPLWGASSELVGIKIGCRETEGRSGDMTITTPWPVTSAARVNAWGKTIAGLPASGNKPSQVKIAVSAYELFQIVFNL